MTEVVMTTGAIRRAKLQSNHHHQEQPTPIFLQAKCPSCCPTNKQCQSTEAKVWWYSWRIIYV